MEMAQSSLHSLCSGGVGNILISCCFARGPLCFPFPFYLNCAVGSSWFRVRWSRASTFFPHAACSNYSANYYLLIISPLLLSNSFEDLSPCARHITWGAGAKALGMEFLFLGLGMPELVLKGIFQRYFGHLYYY